MLAHARSYHLHDGLWLKFQKLIIGGHYNNLIFYTPPSCFELIDFIFIIKDINKLNKPKIHAHADA